MADIHSFVSVCPFSGVVCKCRKVWAPPLLKNFNAAGFNRHRSQESCQQTSSDVVESAEAGFRNVACLELALPSYNARSSNLSAMHLDQTLYHGTFCQDCNKVLTVQGDRKRRKCNKVAESTTHAMVTSRSIRKVISNGTYLLITESNLTESFCPIYKEIRSQVETARGPVSEEHRPLTVIVAANVMGTSIPPEIFNQPPPSRPHESPISWPEFDEDEFEADIFGILSGSANVETELSSGGARAAIYQRQGLADKNAPNHGRIICWMEDMGYARLATTMDDEDYEKMSKGLLDLLRDPETMIEMRVRDAVKDLFDFTCDEVLPQISPIVKTTIMLVSCGHVQQRVNKMQRALALPGVTPENRVAIFNILSSYSDMATFGSRSLQVPEDATRKKYLKLFQEFIVFVLRRCMSMGTRPDYFNEGMFNAITGSKSATRVAVAQLVFIAIGFPGKVPSASASDTIATELSVVDMFVMAKAIRGTRGRVVAPSDELQQQLCDQYSPSDARTAGNGILFSFRVSWCFAKMAVDNSDAPAQALVQRMGMAENFGGLPRIRLLAESIRICKQASDEMVGLTLPV